MATIKQFKAVVTSFKEVDGVAGNPLKAYVDDWTGDEEDVETFISTKLGEDVDTINKGSIIVVITRLADIEDDDESEDNEQGG